MSNIFEGHTGLLSSWEDCPEPLDFSLLMEEAMHVGLHLECQYHNPGMGLV